MVVPGVATAEACRMVAKGCACVPGFASDPFGET